jgi:protease-4
MFEPIGPEARRVTEDMVAESQRWFVGLVEGRRKIRPADVPGLVQGRVFSGREALGHRLVDAIGGESEAVKYLEEKREVAKSLKVIDWRPRRDSDFSFLRFIGTALVRLGGAGAEAQFLEAEHGFGRLLLDGLVSVWQPAEK